MTASGVRFSVMGAGGYIGSHLTGALARAGAEVIAIRRGDAFLGRDLGHLIYAVAVTNDASERASDAVRANACLLLDVLSSARFESLLYLSTAQVYFGSDRSSEESLVRIDPRDPGDLYRASKTLGETLCLASDRPTVRVARLSAVWGERLSSRSFLASVVAGAVDRGHVELRSSLDSERDFVHLADVSRALTEIALCGRQRLYNVASGTNVSNAAIVEALERETGCSVSVVVDAARTSYPRVDISRIKGELGFSPSMDVIAAMPAIVLAYRRERAVEGT